MKPETHDELDHICTEICDKLCKWPCLLVDQEALDDKCAGCQVMIDLANLVEKLEATS